MWKEKGESIYDGTIRLLSSEFSSFVFVCDSGMIRVIAENKTGCVILNGFEGKSERDLTRVSYGARKLVFCI